MMRQVEVIITDFSGAQRSFKWPRILLKEALHDAVGRDVANTAMIEMDMLGSYRINTATSIGNPNEPTSIELRSLENAIGAYQ